VAGALNRLARARALLLAALCGLCLLAPWAAWAADGAPLRLDDAAGRVEAWPAVRILEETDRPLALADVLARRAEFAVPEGAAATLGLRKTGVWLHLPLAVAAGSDGAWIFDIGYAVLNRAEVHVLRPGAAVERVVLGNMQPQAERPFHSRSHALPLSLAAGQNVELFIRVETLGGMILPITLSKPSVFHADALDEQLLQGLMTGLGVFLLLYSLAQWLSVRESMYLKYALLISGSIVFSVTQFGLGALYLWPDRLWVEQHIAGIAALVASAGTFLFVEEVLSGPRPRPVFRAVMHTGAALLLLTAVIYALDWIHVHQVSWVVGTLGLLPALLGLPGAVQRARRGDSVGWYFLAAWLGYFVATFVMVSVIKGRLPANWWTLHSFQFGATLDMLLFMRVMTLRLERMHAAATQAAHERDTLRSQAHSDALTGLPNRRGLAAQLEARLPNAGPGRLLALYLLDLDGFKQVNDLHGHEVGDALLIAVAERLRQRVRSGDVVARLGGDEFIVVVDELPDTAEAETAGRALIEAFSHPFDAHGTTCRVGLTVGYVVAPLDGADVRTLMRLADGAMYAGKQAGKHSLRRAGAQRPAGDPGGDSPSTVSTNRTTA
jgi:diguanylate cyclase